MRRFLDVFKNKRRYLHAELILVGIVACYSASACVATGDSPQAWRNVTEQQLGDGPNTKLREGDPLGFSYTRALGDFDGDGIQDVASLKFNRSRNVYAVLVQLSSEKGNDERVAYKGPLEDLDSVGIKSVSQGVYKTACAKGFGKESNSCQELITLDNNAIELIYFEASSQYIYWDGAEFKNIFVSD